MSRIYELRIRHKWTQTDLAEASGLSQNAISNYESGERQAGSAAVAALARALGCSADYLLEITDDPSPYSALPGLTPDEQAVIEALRASDRLKAIRLIVEGE